MYREVISLECRTCRFDSQEMTGCRILFRTETAPVATAIKSFRFIRKFHKQQSETIPFAVCTPSAQSSTWFDFKICLNGLIAVLFMLNKYTSPSHPRHWRKSIDGGCAESICTICHSWFLNFRLVLGEASVSGGGIILTF